VQSCAMGHAASVKIRIMGTVEQIELQLAKLSPQELARFCAWYSQFDADAWDQQLEQDAGSGKLDALAEAALQAHAAGTTKPL
ncbi:MAG: hypothetical protein WBW61_06075, partial [Rhodanobacteraceae bacterium]